MSMHVGVKQLVQGEGVMQKQNQGISESKEVLNNTGVWDST